MISRLINHQGNSYYYTGIGIKKYLQDSLFCVNKNYQNKNILSGKWSAYAHFNPLISFINLLDKINIQKDNKVLIHPLCPPSFVDILKKRGLVIHSIEIDKNTMEFGYLNFKNYISAHKIDLVIFYGFTGLYKNTHKELNFLSENSINSILFVDNPSINQDLLTCFNNLNYGGVIFNFGENLVLLPLSEFVEGMPSEKSFYISWYIETRTRSLLEYHLKNSEPHYRELIEAWFYILLKVSSNLSLKEKVSNWGYSKIYPEMKKFESIDSAQRIILKKVSEIETMAVPDIFFELNDPVIKKESLMVSLELDVERSAKNKDIYNFFLNQVKISQPGSLEIPKIQIGQDYLEYFFFTTDKSFWSEKFKNKNVLVRNYFPIHEDIKGLVKNVDFFENYMISFSVDKIITNSITLDI